MDSAPANQTTDGARPVILVADDQEFNLRLVSHLLKQVDARLVTATNGREAYEAAVAHKPKLILLDIMMPGVDGLACIRMLRANPEFTHTPIVAITAVTAGEADRKIVSMGANAYLAKPVNVDQLLGLVRHYLAG